MVKMKRARIKRGKKMPKLEVDKVVYREEIIGGTKTDNTLKNMENVVTPDGLGEVVGVDDRFVSVKLESGVICKFEPKDVNVSKGDKHD